jgi:hypothetical protein
VKQVSVIGRTAGGKLGKGKMESMQLWVNKKEGTPLKDLKTGEYTYNVALENKVMYNNIVCGWASRFLSQRN